MKSLNKKIYASLLALLVTAFASLPADAQEQYVYGNNNMLVESVRSGDIHSINTILNNGADVNEQNRTMNTALMIASKIGDRVVIETLLAHEADPNIQNKAGGTALMIAAKYGHTHVVKELLKHGANPNIQNNSGYKASRFAAAYKHQKVYKLLAVAEEDALRSAIAEKEKKKTS